MTVKAAAVCVGATVSTVKLNAVPAAAPLRSSVVVLPAASVIVALYECAPSARAAGSANTSDGAGEVADATATAPPSRNSRSVSPASSADDSVSATTGWASLLVPPLAIAPVTGATSSVTPKDPTVCAGGVRSTATVADGLAGPVLPATSRIDAVTATLPSPCSVIVESGTVTVTVPALMSGAVSVRVTVRVPQPTVSTSPAAAAVPDSETTTGVPSAASAALSPPAASVTTGTGGAPGATVSTVMSRVAGTLGVPLMLV